MGRNHTGDLLLALPVIKGLEEAGYEVGVQMPEIYYRPLSFLNLPRFTNIPKHCIAVTKYTKKGRHKTSNWIESLKQHGIYVTPVKAILDIVPNVSLLPDSNWCLLQPWCEDESKQYPVEVWQAIADRATAKGMKVALAGPAKYKEQIVGALNIVGQDKDTWPSTIAAASLVVSVDSGAGHLADALGIPTIVLFKSTDPDEWAPYWDRSGVVTNLEDALKVMDNIL